MTSWITGTCSVSSFSLDILERKKSPMDSSFTRFSQRETTSHLSKGSSINQGRLGLKSVKRDDRLQTENILDNKSDTKGYSQKNAKLFKTIVTLQYRMSIDY